MKGCRILLLCVCATAALPRLALAGSPPGPQSLATVEGIFDFCAKVDTKDAASFQSLRKTVSAGASQHDLDGMRGTPEYKDALAAINDALAKVPSQDAANTCARGVAPPSTHVAHTDRRGTDKHPVRDDRHH